MTRKQCVCFELDAADVESAVRQFICAHPDIANDGYVVEVNNARPAFAVATRRREQPASPETLAERERQMTPPPADAPTV